jgi:hypothetical protein
LLTAHCQNDHDHLPYQVRSDDGTWTFDTSSEAVYPALLAARVAAAVKKFFQAKNISFFLPPTLGLKPWLFSTGSTKDAPNLFLSLPPSGGSCPPLASPTSKN